MKNPGYKTILLHPDDNVAVCIDFIAAGEQIMLNSLAIMVPQAIHLGHKLALKKIVGGETIIKYGVPIGTAITDIAEGEHVHIHNIKSNYIPTEEQVNVPIKI